MQTWQERRTIVRDALLKFLATVPAGTVLATTQVTIAVANAVPAVPMADVINDVGKLAPLVGDAIASHDGEAYIRFGRANRRWRWHGQMVPVVPAATTKPEDFL